MALTLGLPFLRPYLYRQLPVARRSACRSSYATLGRFKDANITSETPAALKSGSIEPDASELVDIALIRSSGHHRGVRLDGPKANRVIQLLESKELQYKRPLRDKQGKYVTLGQYLKDDLDLSTEHIVTGQSMSVYTFGRNSYN